MQAESLAEARVIVGWVSSNGREGSLFWPRKRIASIQLRVAVGDWWHLLAAPVTVLDDHRVPAVDLDVLYVGHFEQRLQPVAEHRILDLVTYRLL